MASRSKTMSTAETNTPGWVDLGSPDVAASNRFYSELFGWEPNVAPMPEAGGYTIYTKDGKPVAGGGGGLLGGAAPPPCPAAPPPHPAAAPRAAGAAGPPRPG